MAIPFLPIAVGTIAALCIQIVTTQNPSRIPIRRIALRAIPGIALFAALGYASALLVWLAIERGFSIPAGSVSAWIISMLIGFASLQIPKLKDELLTMQMVMRLGPIAGLIQRLDEATRLYTNKIIDREERKLDHEFLAAFEGQGANVVHRLFEIHKREIGRRIRLRLKAQGSNAQKVTGLFTARLPQVKLKFLLHSFGYQRILAETSDFATEPHTRFPNWPLRSGERREQRTANIVVGRREYEQPHFHVVADDGDRFQVLEADRFSYYGRSWRIIMFFTILVLAGPLVVLTTLKLHSYAKAHDTEASFVLFGGIFAMAASGFFLVYEALAQSRRSFHTICLLSAAFILWYEGWLSFSRLF